MQSKATTSKGKGKAEDDYFSDMDDFIGEFGEGELDKLEFEATQKFQDNNGDTGNTQHKRQNLVNMGMSYVSADDGSFKNVVVTTRALEDKTNFSLNDECLPRKMFKPGPHEGKDFETVAALPFSSSLVMMSCDAGRPKAGQQLPLREQKSTYRDHPLPQCTGKLDHQNMKNFSSKVWAAFGISNYLPSIDCLLNNLTNMIKSYMKCQGSTPQSLCTHQGKATSNSELLFATSSNIVITCEALIDALTCYSTVCKRRRVTLDQVMSSRFLEFAVAGFVSVTQFASALEERRELLHIIVSYLGTLRLFGSAILAQFLDATCEKYILPYFSSLLEDSELSNMDLMAVSQGFFILANSSNWEHVISPPGCLLYKICSYLSGNLPCLLTVSRVNIYLQISSALDLIIQACSRERLSVVSSRCSCFVKYLELFIDVSHQVIDQLAAHNGEETRTQTKADIEVLNLCVSHLYSLGPHTKSARATNPRIQLDSLYVLMAGVPALYKHRKMSNAEVVKMDELLALEPEFQSSNLREQQPHFGDQVS